MLNGKICLMGMGGNKVLLKRKTPLWIFVIISALLGIIAIVLVMSQTRLTNEHEAEIKKIVTANGGQVLKIEKVSPESSPFAGDYNKSNVVYKIVFEKETNQFIAWYRGVNVVNDIHAKNPTALQGGYGEKWIFPTEIM